MCVCVCVCVCAYTGAADEGRRSAARLCAEPLRVDARHVHAGGLASRSHVCAGTGRAPRSHICAETGRSPPTSAPGPGSARPHLRRDRARPRHICAGTGLTPCMTRFAAAPHASARVSRLLSGPAAPAPMTTRACAALLFQSMTGLDRKASEVDRVPL
jgi:hypothetical protein